jgi:ParB family chromosome partitioning protein
MRKCAGRSKRIGSAGGKNKGKSLKELCMREEKIELAGLRFSSNRAYGGEGDIPILAEDIKRNGIINPITVKAIREEIDAGQMQTVYEVIAGRRRVRAVDLLGWNDIPCRILEGDEVDRAEEIAGSENINRIAMHPLDEAAVFSKLIENGRPIEELAKHSDRSISAIWQRIQLLELSDDIKTLFRNGNLSLYAAAMLKSLDEKGRQEFYKKFKDDFYVENNKEIPISDIRGFLSSYLNNRLFEFIVTKECRTCRKRTFYQDKGLFPELGETDDSCLDQECYMKRWNALVAAKIKNCKKASPTHTDTVILAVDGKLKKWLGKNPAFDGTPYEVRSAGYSETTDKPGKNDVPCIRIELDYHDKLNVSAQYWKHQTASSSQGRDSGFAPVVKLLDLPKTESASALQAFEENCSKISQWDLHRKVKEKSFWRLMEERAKQPPGKDEVTVYLKNNVFDNMDSDHKRIFKLFMGEDYSESGITKIKTLPVEKLFFLMAAMEFDGRHLPSVFDFNDVNQREKDFISWLGITRDAVKKLYQEEIKALMPKAEPPGDTEKADGKKPSGKKAAAKKPAKVKAKK